MSEPEDDPAYRALMDQPATRQQLLDVLTAVQLQALGHGTVLAALLIGDLPIAREMFDNAMALSDRVTAMMRRLNDMSCGEGD